MDISAIGPKELTLCICRAVGSNRNEYNYRESHLDNSGINVFVSPWAGPDGAKHAC